MTVLRLAILVAHRRGGTDPGIAWAAIVFMAHHAIDPINGAAVAVIGDAGALVAMIGLGRADRSEGAQSQEGGEKERTEFHNDDRLICWFGLVSLRIACFLRAAREVHCIRRSSCGPIR